MILEWALTNSLYTGAGREINQMDGDSWLLFLWQLWIYECAPVCKSAILEWAGQQAHPFLSISWCLAAVSSSKTASETSRSPHCQPRAGSCSQDWPLRLMFSQNTLSRNKITIRVKNGQTLTAIKTQALSFLQIDHNLTSLNWRFVSFNSWITSSLFQNNYFNKATLK